jgi:hypothetical protein
MLEGRDQCHTQHVNSCSMRIRECDYCVVICFIVSIVSSLVSLILFFVFKNHFHHHQLDQ